MGTYLGSLSNTSVGKYLGTYYRLKNLASMSPFKEALLIYESWMCA